MSAPAANARSLPVITIALMPSSASNFDMASPISSITRSFRAFSCFGRLMVIRPTRSRVSTTIIS
jgi:hypothetical protein